jgi:uracil-DNA glycosylase
MTKEERYKALVAKRKAFTFKDLNNPSQIDNGAFDCEHIDAWSQWQGNLDAKILVIGQDWGDVSYFTKHRGKDNAGNKTNQNLSELFQEININIGSPNNSIPQSVFLTNAILGIKGIAEQKQMSGIVKTSWIRESTEAFTKELIDIIQPEIIITLGKIPLYAMRLIHSEIPNEKLSVLKDENPINLKDQTRLFAFYHCGGLGLASRKLNLQKEDWQKIKPFM